MRETRELPRRQRLGGVRRVDASDATPSKILAKDAARAPFSSSWSFDRALRSLSQLTQSAAEPAIVPSVFFEIGMIFSAELPTNVPSDARLSTQQTVPPLYWKATVVVP